MQNIPTPHIAAKLEDIAKTVLMPGDPLRAEFIAKNYLENVKCFNTVRNMLGFTGTYKGKRISVMGSGMGIPSIGIYSYELFNFYDVDNIIRIGTAGGLCDDVNLRDVIIAMGACTNSNYALQFKLPGTFAPIASYDLLSKAVNVAYKEGITARVGNVLSSDTLYNADKEAEKKWGNMGVLAVEMESMGLYLNAALAKKQALCIVTISDILSKGLSLSADERQTSFKDMMKIALETA